MRVEWITKGRDVRVPRKVKKAAKKTGATITGRVGNSWLAARNWAGE